MMGKGDPSSVERRRLKMNGGGKKMRSRGNLRCTTGE